MKIIIETIDNQKQRYNTVGDWQWEDQGETLHVKVSKLEDINNANHLCLAEYMEFVIGIHEAIEAMVCKKHGVTEEDVDKFDTDPKMVKDIARKDIEGGDHPSAPYKQEHTLATGIERTLCYALGIPWFEYENQLIELSENYNG